MILRYNLIDVIVEDSFGDYVKYEEYLKRIENLEYELRYLQEQLNSEKEEKLHWQDMYNELYELTH